MEEGTRQISIVAVAVVIVVATLVGATLYGCTKANEQYYGLANSCISQGGSWGVPSGPYSGICIAGHKQ